MKNVVVWRLHSRTLLLVNGEKILLENKKKRQESIFRTDGWLSAEIVN